MYSNFKGLHFELMDWFCPLIYTPIITKLQFWLVAKETGYHTPITRRLNTHFNHLKLHSGYTCKINLWSHRVKATAGGFKNSEMRREIETEAWSLRKRKKYWSKCVCAKREERLSFLCPLSNRKAKISMRWESTGVVRINSRVLWGRCERLCVCVCWVRRLVGASEHGWTDFPRRPEARAAAARARADSSK